MKTLVLEIPADLWEELHTHRRKDKGVGKMPYEQILRLGLDVASAALSPCGRYRYRLGREWPGGHGTVLFVMLNPSTADAEVDDPTVRRCVGFARRWGFRRLEVGNLFARRASKPSELWRVPDPIGPENDYHLVEMSKGADCVVAAWGQNVGQRRRDLQVLRILDGPVAHLGLTRRGYPRHPLYLRADVVRHAWEGW